MHDYDGAGHHDFHGQVLLEDAELLMFSEARYAANSIVILHQIQSRLESDHTKYNIINIIVMNRISRPSAKIPRLTNIRLAGGDRDAAYQDIPPYDPGPPSRPSPTVLPDPRRPGLFW